jgi:hypothetical protein
MREAWPLLGICFDGLVGMQDLLVCQSRQSHFNKMKDRWS